ncbi:MAG: polysaccharide lyase family 7 protein [Nevskia sp.]|nr:polysaccharide lyase family 7 protein [Nevskia sp.]
MSMLIGRRYLVAVPAVFCALLGSTVALAQSIPSVSIDNLSVVEGDSGNAIAKFTFKLSAASKKTVSVGFATANGTATAGSDYTARTGTTTFSPGQTSRTQSFTVIGDKRSEPNETFVVNLSKPVGLSIARTQGVATIVNDDQTIPSVSVDDVSVVEGSSSAVAKFTFKLSAPSTQSVSVRFATANGTAMAGSDYTARSGLTTFAPGETSRTQSFTVSGDTLLEQDETFFVNLSTPAGLSIAKARGVATIVNDDAGADTAPNAFGFAALTNVPIGSVQTSEAITISGINAPSPISILGGSYSLNGQPFTNLDGTLGNGDSVRVQQTASPSFSTKTTALLTIGGVAGSWDVTTREIDEAPDTAPNAFGFTALTNVPIGSVQTSEAITISGINAPSPISILGGSYSLNGQPFTNLDGTLGNGDSVLVQQLASPSFSTKTTALLTIGGVAGSWDVTTYKIDDKPDPIVFQAMKNAAPGSFVTSNTITVSGINTPVALSVSGGTYSVDGGPWDSAPGRIDNGAKVRVQARASSSFGKTTDANLTVAGVQTTFRVGTVALDKTKDVLIFSSVAEVAQAQTVTSTPLLIEGVYPNSPVSVAGVGGAYSIDGRPFTIEDGLVSNGSSVRMQLVIKSPASSATAVFYVGDKSGSFTLATGPADTEPTPFSFTSNSGSEIDIDQTRSITVQGISAAAPISIDGGTYQIGSGPFTGKAGVINEGQMVTVKLRAAHSYSTATELRLTIGGISATYRNTTSPFPKPRISLGNGVYSSARSVSITVPDGLPQGTAIYYTLDRSKPSVAGIPYTGSFTVRETGSLRAAVVRTDGAIVGPVATGYFQFYATTEALPVYVPVGTDLGLWKIDLPIGRFGQLFSASPPFVAGFSSPPYFQPNADGSIDFSAPVTGMTTANSEDPRSELRQLNADGTQAAWRIGDDLRTLSSSLTVTQVPSSGKVTIGQIHTNDGSPLVLLDWRGDQGQPGSLVFAVRAHPDDPSGASTVLASNLPWGVPISYRIHVSRDGILSITGVGRMAVVPISAAWRTKTQYFKAGTYVHDNEGLASEGGAAQFHGINLVPELVP